MSDHTMEHDRLRESTALYVLEALDELERAEFERHLATCADCAEEVRSLRTVAGALPLSVPQVDPPFALRSRILSAAGAQTKRSSSTVVAMPSAPRASRVLSRAGWLSAAALLVLSAGLGVYSWSLGQQIVGLRERLTDVIAQLDRSQEQTAVAVRTATATQTRLTVLLAPDMRQVDLEGQPAAPRASGRAFWSRSRGLVFTASNLPPLPRGRTYQLWMVSAEAPLSAGVLSPDQTGGVAETFNTPADVPAPVAIALTIEPEGGLPAPTGDKYLVGLTH